MPSTQLTKGLLKPSRVNSFAEKILSLLEKVSDEAFWNSFFGERATNLMKRYFGSDVVFLGFIVYLAPILGYHFNSLFYLLLSQFKDRMYVSIQIGKEESGYEAIQQFVATQTRKIRQLRDVEGRCVIKDETDGNFDMQNATPPPQLELFPLDEVEHMIQYKGHTMWVTKKKNSDVNHENRDHYYSNNIKDLLGMMNTNPCIQVLMRGQDLNLLRTYIQEWINIHFEKKDGKLTIWKVVPSRYEGYDWNNVGAKELRSFESVILKDGQKEEILKDIQSFRRRQHWYSVRGIPYRRGYLLHGPPGTGKTSLVQSVASKINMNVAIISLSGSITDENFNVLLQDAPRNSILVMEDIDHCVIKDPNTDGDTSSAKITMSGLLNALDGVVAQEGSMVFMTCNDLSRIQPALLRPGRIDMKMELGYANKTQINKMFWRFMGKDDHLGIEPSDNTTNKKLKEAAIKFTDMIPDLYVTPAELQNFFIMNLLDGDIFDEDTEEEPSDFSYLFDAMPQFLETIKRDREQAKEHKDNHSSTAKKAGSIITVIGPSLPPTEDTKSVSVDIVPVEQKDSVATTGDDNTTTLGGTCSNGSENNDEEDTKTVVEDGVVIVKAVKA